ncbi:hypothetical protein BDV18DRAFT_159302 [Aspergillus unguis]
MTDEEPSINIPSLLTLAVVSFFVIRWFFKRDDDNSSGAPGSRARARGNVVDPAQVEQINQMFPQLNTREIMWDLQRNGGNAAATTERVLSGRGLDAPPPSFQPLIAIPPTGVPAQQQPAPSSATKSDGQDLISRYNLSAKVAEASGAETGAKPASGGGWSQNKEERQRLLQKRRDDMIIAARRRMEQQQKQQGITQ